MPTDVQKDCLIAHGWSPEDFGQLWQHMQWYRADGSLLGRLPTDDYHIQRYTARASDCRLT